MVEPALPEIQFIALPPSVLLHGRHGGRLVVIGADVHTLDTQALLPRKEFHSREVLLFLFRGLPDGPAEDLFRYKLRQADEGDPPEIRLAGLVHALDILLPPQSLQGRHHIVKVALQLVLT